MIRQYSISNGKTCELKSYINKISPPSYDSVVDRSQFRPDSEQVRLFHLSGQGSTNVNLVYDEGRKPSDLEVKLRQGQFDKAEVSQLQHLHLNQ